MLCGVYMGDACTGRIAATRPVALLVVSLAGEPGMSESDRHDGRGILGVGVWQLHPMCRPKVRPRSWRPWRRSPPCMSRRWMMRRCPQRVESPGPRRSSHRWRGSISNQMEMLRDSAYAPYAEFRAGYVSDTVGWARRELDLAGTEPMAIVRSREGLVVHMIGGERVAARQSSRTTDSDDWRSLGGVWGWMASSSMGGSDLVSTRSLDSFLWLGR